MGGLKLSAAPEPQLPPASCCVPMAASCWPQFCSISSDKHGNELRFPWGSLPAKPILPSFRAAIIVALFALLPLLPWTIRNFRTLHHFQPLAPRYANATDEPSLPGFNHG